MGVSAFSMQHQIKSLPNSSSSETSAHVANQNVGMYVFVGCMIVCTSIGAKAILAHMSRMKSPRVLFSQHNITPKRGNGIFIALGALILLVMFGQLILIGNLPTTRFELGQKLSPLVTINEYSKAGDALTGPHLIPHRTIFIHTLHNEPQDTDPHIYNNILNTHRIYSHEWDEPNAPMWFLSENDCVEVVRGSEPKLLQHYLKEPQGKYKADICRIAALYVKGGYYFDVDMGTVNAVRLDHNVAFATAKSYDGAGLYNSFIAAAPKHPILRKSFDVLLEHYEVGGLPLKTQEHHMGPGVLQLAFDRTPNKDVGVVFLDLEERRMANRKSAYRHVDQPQGKGCCCDFFVEHKNKIENKIYFWSRIPGSNSLCEMVK